jgi:hypothetical protein
MGYVMPQQQATEQIIQAALQAPINNLVVFGIIVALLIVLGSGFLVWKFMPIILNQIQQLINNNTKLTELAEKTAAQAEKAQQSADKNAVEMVKTNSLLTDQNVLLTDFKNFQKLNNDQTADVGKKVETLTTTVDKIPESITSLKADITARIDQISEKLDELLKDRADCTGFKAEWDTFRRDVLDRIPSAASAISSTVVNIPPANVFPDDDEAASLPKAS